MNTSTMISTFITTNYLTGVAPDELEADYDLIANGVIDSLGLARLVSWIGDEFELDVSDRHISPEDFRSVSTISEFVESVY